MTLVRPTQAPSSLPGLLRAANAEAAKALRNGKLVHIDGAGHNLHHDKRQKTVEALNAFLGSL